jgi:hypothetical protein
MPIMANMTSGTGVRQVQQREARTDLESSSTPSAPSGQGDTSLSAAVQTIEADKGLLRLRTAGSFRSSSP